MSYANYAKSIIERFSLKDLMKKHDLKGCVEEEVVQLPHFRIDPSWIEISVDGQKAEFLDCEAMCNSRELRAKVMSCRNYFYLEYSGGLRQLWIRNGSNFILIASNNF